MTQIRRINTDLIVRFAHNRLLTDFADKHG